MIGTKISNRLRSIVAKLLAVITGGTLITGSAAASHGSVPCNIPNGLMPLFEFLHTIEQLLLVAGIGIGMIGFLVAAIYIMMPGEDANRRGKSIAKHVLIGAVLLLAANLIMAFLISQFPVC